MVSCSYQPAALDKFAERSKGVSIHGCFMSLAMLSVSGRLCYLQLCFRDNFQQETGFVIAVQVK